jgi:hypothetical protein
VPDAFTWSRYRALVRFGEQAYADTVSDNGQGGTTPLDPPAAREQHTGARHGQGQPSSGRKGSTALITDARTPASVEMRSRVRRYTYTMAFRTACFISMVFVEGAARWVLFACALVLPYIAVIGANQANQRSIRKRANLDLLPDRPQLTTGPDEPGEPPALPDSNHDRDRRDQAVA